MSKLKKGLALVLTLCMMLSLLPVITPSAEATGETENSTFSRIFHLDCGRKYFSVTQIEALIDTLAENNYTHMELAIGNDGLRFLLDDMSVEANNKTYTSNDVKVGIQAGNTSYYNDPNGNALTETEMNTIISYANGKGIEIIPLLNSPGHMDAILDCMEAVGISNPAYSNSARTVDVTNTEAVAFTQALIGKYITYFAGQDCTYFNMGCDEYANDVSNSGFAGLISSGKYGNFVDYVNGLAGMVKTAGMIPMAFNDGIYYSGNTSSGTFDSDIAIAYWTSGWPGYSPASASFLAGKGHEIISTNDAWYYVLGRAAGNSSGYTIATAQNGVKNTACTDIPGSNDLTAAGCMICLWCDTPSASYSDTEVNNVTGLISTFAGSNPTYFAASSGSGETGGNTDGGNTGGEAAVEKTITVVAGKTATDTIDGADYLNNIVETGLNKSIATVSAEYEQVTGGQTFTAVDSVSQNSAYYIQASDGKYLTSNGAWSADISDAAPWTVTSYGVWGYRLKKGSTYLRYNNGWTTTTDWGNATTLYFNEGTFYRSANFSGYSDPLGVPGMIDTTAPVNATIVTFHGVAPGTTYVTVGNTHYTINVVAEDLSEVSPVQIEWWITNYPITSTDSNHLADGSYMANSKTTYYTSLTATTAYGEEGVELSAVVPATGTYNYAGEDGCVFWKGTRLTGTGANVKQTGASGSDSTAVGDEFAYIRYFNGKWAISVNRATWIEISTADQLVAYYLQATKVTKEVTTMTKDWGLAVGTRDGSDTQVALSVAVVYPDGSLSPAENNIYSTSTLIFNYWSGRDIGIVAPELNDQYDVEKITVTPGTRVSGKDGIFTTDSDDGIIWEKKDVNEDGDKWFNETSYWDDSMDTTPMVNGATSNIVWGSDNSAYLVLIYLKPVHYDTNLSVNWVDDSAGGALISTMEVAVSSDGTPTTFYNGLQQTSALPTEDVGGTFTLDDDAYVTNSSNVPQTFNKNISTVPGVADVYKTGLYQYVSADLSADGMTLTLHYNINSSKLSKQYVVDFGLPVNVPLSDLIQNTGSVTTVEITGGNATVNTDKSINYQPAAVMTGTATVGVKLTFNDNSTQTVRIGFVPATTVYYEEGFAAYIGSWTGTVSKDIGTQTAQVAGSSSDEYGYDTKYARENIGPSNGSQATSSTKGDKAKFTFTGTGVDIYTNSTASTGSLMIQVKNNAGSTVKLLQVNTDLLNGTTNATTGQAVNGYNVPVASITGLTHGSYTVTITNISGTVNLDGFRVYGTLATEPKFYTTDQEDNPTFIELRDQQLKAMSITSTGSNQTNASTELPDGSNVTVAVVANSNDYTTETATDLLNNGPKNEIYLQPNQALTLKITTDREVQIGLKALNAATSYTINGESESISISTSTDMFYTVLQKATDTNREQKIITITNNGAGILAVTKLKVCDDPNATLGTLTEEDLTDALVSLGIVNTAEEPGGSGGSSGGGGGGSSAPAEPTEPTTPSTGTGLPFTDVTAGDWFLDNVKYVYEKGLMNGTSDTAFSPKQTTNRAMIVTILHRLENSPAVDAQSPFADVAAGQYYANPVAWAAANGIVTGTSDTTFAPLNNITREQMAAILYRYAQFKGYDVSVGEDTNILSYTDAETISEYAIPAIQWAVGSGLINGKGGGVLDPQGSATRAEVSAILARFCEAYAK